MNDEIKIGDYVVSGYGEETAIGRVIALGGTIAEVRWLDGGHVEGGFDLAERDCDVYNDDPMGLAAARAKDAERSAGR